MRTPSFPLNWPSLVSTARSPNTLWRLWSHKPLHKHDSNKYQSKAFVICDHKSDDTRSVTLVNKAYLVWLMFLVLSSQHYQHRTNQKLRSWANAVFQNRGVCGQAVPSFPSPSPVILFFLLSSRRSRRTRAETLATQAKRGFNLERIKFFEARLSDTLSRSNQLQSRLMPNDVTFSLHFITHVFVRIRKQRSQEEQPYMTIYS